MRIVYFLGLSILIFACDQTVTREISAAKVSLRYVGEVKDGDWIKIDSFMFVHKQRLPAGTNRLQAFDSVDANGHRFRYRILSPSVLTHTVGDHKKSQQLISTEILGELIQHIDIINGKHPQYQMNVGARLWLEETLEISSYKGRPITVEFSPSYPMTVSSD